MLLESTRTIYIETKDALSETHPLRREVLSLPRPEGCIGRVPGRVLAAPCLNASEKEGASIVATCTQALDYSHSQGLMHRDVAGLGREQQNSAGQAAQCDDRP